MIRRLLEVASWLGLAAALSSALYWGFLSATEASVVTLLWSGTLLVMLIVVVAVAGSATMLLSLGESRRTSLLLGARRAHWLVLAGLGGALLTWAILRGDDWVARHSGEISAWFIATLNWADVTPLFRAEGYLSAWLRWVVIPAGVLTAVASVLRDGGPALVSSRWIRAAWRWQTLAVTTAAFLILIALPWRLAAWQPATPLSTSIEPVLVGLRLSLVAIAMALGAATFVLTTAQAASATGRR